jgi:hypothetical protein
MMDNGHDRTEMRWPVDDLRNASKLSKQCRVGKGALLRAVPTRRRTTRGEGPHVPSIESDTLT